MKSKSKNLLQWLIILLLIITISYPVRASEVTLPHTIYERVNKEQIASGVTHESIERFTTSGWMNINVVRIDLKNEYTELKGMFNPNGIPNRSTVSNLVDTHGAVAGVNGDYFNYSPLPSAMGTLINDGVLISSPLEAGYSLPDFYITNSGETGIDYMGRYITVTNLENNYIFEINTVNKVSADFKTPTLLNSNWGSTSIGNRFHKDLVEMVIENDEVKEIRVGQQATNIPKDGFVVAVRGDRAEEFNQFNVGDKIRYSVTTKPNLDNIKFAIGGGSIILREGQPVLTNIHSSGLQPRTGLGVNKDDTEMILVTVDGRSSTYKGINQKTFGALLKDLGAYHGLNLDGGGSTAMAIRKPGNTNSTVVNYPSGGSQRKVVDGVGVFSNAPAGVLDNIKLTLSEPTMFKNTRRNLQFNAYDGNMKPVEFNLEDVEFKIEGVEGSMNGLQFIPTTSGTATITANYKNLESKINIKVYEDIKNIYAVDNVLSVQANKEYNLPNIYGQDKNGNSSRLYLDDVNFTVSGDIGNIENGVFKSNSNPQSGVITIKAGEGIDNIYISGLSEERVIESFENIENFGNTKYPDEVTTSIELSDEFNTGSKSIKLNYDFSKGDGNRAAYLLLYPELNGLSLNANATQIGLWIKGNADNAWLRGQLIDANGKEYTVDFSKNIDWNDWKQVNAIIPSEAKKPVKLQRIYVVETNTESRQAGSILIDSLSTYSPVKIDPTTVNAPAPTQLKDELESKTDLSSEGFRFAIFSETSNLDDVKGAGSSDKLISTLNKNQLGISLNGFSEDFRGKLGIHSLINGNAGYSANKNGDAYFVTLDTKNKGISNSNSYQWTHLVERIMNREEKNIIITSTSPIWGRSGFTDQKEAIVLHEKLVELQEKGKNVFVIHGGFYNTFELKDGVRYIGINSDINKTEEYITHQAIVEFQIKDDSISYNINKIFR